MEIATVNVQYFLLCSTGFAFIHFTYIVSILLNIELLCTSYKYIQALIVSIIVIVIVINWITFQIRITNADNDEETKNIKKMIAFGLGNKYGVE